MNNYINLETVEQEIKEHVEVIRSSDKADEDALIWADLLASALYHIKYRECVIDLLSQQGYETAVLNAYEQVREQFEQGDI